MKKPHQADADRPFPGVPVWQRYVGIGPIEEARQKLCRMINRGEALGVVMGPPGTGKTLLCHKLASLHRQSHEIVMLGDIRVTSRLGLIQQVLFHLGQPHLGKDEDALHLALVQTLNQASGAARKLLLLIDEAQMLTSDLLDEIRMMTNIVRDGQPMVQTILAGGPRLEDALSDPQLESLTQRIAARCYLHPLTHGETDQYIRTSMSSMRLAIDDQAISSVHHASGGIPRLINQLMDQAIEVAVSSLRNRLDDTCIQIAWSELQQLPSPILESDLRPHSGSIEFGELDGVTFDFENETIPVTPSTRTASEAAARVETAPKAEANAGVTASAYADIALILESASIDCLSDLAAQSSYGYWSQVAAEAVARAAEPLVTRPSAAAPSLSSPIEQPTVRIIPVTTRSTIVIDDEPEPATPMSHELFGAEFDHETSLPIDLNDSVRQRIDPANDELTLHDEIRRLSAVAEAAVTGGVAGQRPDRQSSRPGDMQSIAITGERELRFAPEEPAAPGDSYDLPDELVAPLAVVWSDEQSDNDCFDDRDMLVIEEDVSVIIDTPETGFVASGAMRKPSLKIVQNYQNLFSRLRGQQ